MNISDPPGHRFPLEEEPDGETADALDELESMLHVPALVSEQHPANIAARVASEAERQLNRLEQLYRVFKDRALNGDPKAADICLKIGDRIAKLMGLDAPDRIDIQGSVSLVSILAGIRDKERVSSLAHDSENVIDVETDLKNVIDVETDSEGESASCNPHSFIIQRQERHKDD